MDEKWQINSHRECNARLRIPIGAIVTKDTKALN